MARAAVRVNPDVDARTHGKISTGKAENKFGVSIGEARRWFAARAALTHVQLDGLHVHIGSQVLSLEPFCLAMARLSAFWRELAAAGIQHQERPTLPFLEAHHARHQHPRPSLYDAWHDIVPLHDEPRPLQCYDVVGPVCESGDTFARGRELPRCERGDLVLIGGAVAYGASMASTYNSRPLRAEVLIEGDRYAIVRREQSYDELMAGESPALNWQSA